MKQALQYIITSIVDEPEKVVIEDREENGNIEFSITVGPNDIGKVIGKNGRVIRSIRNVMKIPAIKQGKRITISLLDTQ